MFIFLNLFYGRIAYFFPLLVVLFALKLIPKSMYTLGVLSTLTFYRNVWGDTCIFIFLNLFLWKNCIFLPSSCCALCP